jgi:hypothetical protein
MKRERPIDSKIDTSLTLGCCKKISQSISNILSTVRSHLRLERENTSPCQPFFEMVMIYLKFESGLNGFNAIESKLRIDYESTALLNLFSCQAELIGISVLLQLILNSFSLIV